MAIRMRRGNLADFDPTKQLSGEFGVSIDNSAGNQKVFMAFGNGNVKELMTVEDAEAQIGELVDDAVDAAIGDIVDTVTEAAETATAAAQTATTQAGTATTKAGEAASSASSASTDATSAAGSAASADDSAEDSEAWAVGQRDGQDVPATDETYHNNAKYWAEQASQAAGGGVTSFNGRSGSVSPQSGDYTAAMVGLGNVDNTSDMKKPISTATQTALNGKADTSSLTDGSVTKIGTNNVGSSTQPVYINGGVPTAIGKNAAVTFTSSQSVGWYTLATFPTNSSIALRWSNGVQDVFDGFIFINAGFYKSDGHDKVSLTWIGHSWKDNCFPKLRITKDTGTGYAGNLALDVYLSAPGNAPKSRLDVLYDSSQQIELKTTPTAAVYSTVLSETDRKKEDSIITTGNIRQGITTGTPTNINSNLSLYAGGAVKSGNVVQVRLQFDITTTFTPSNSTVICNLPWKPAIASTTLSRIIGPKNNHMTGWSTKTAYFNSTSAQVLMGYGDFEECTAGNALVISGTYLTND